jgi:hypothetical protein
VGSLVVGRPFYNWAQRTSYDLTASYSDQVVRRASGAQVLGFDTAAGNFGGPCDLASDTCLARAWNDRLLQLTAVGHYRIGERHKETFSLGAALVAHAVASIPESHVTPDNEAVFRTYVLPKVRRDVYPYVRYRLAVPDYVVFTNLATYGQSESVQIGPRLDGSFGVPLRVYGASSDGLVVHGLIGYVWAANDALFDVKGEGWSRLENGRVVDQRGMLQLRAASPSFAQLFGRLVFRALWDVRDHDTQKTFVSLGGDSGLRGYPAQAFPDFGASKLLCNAEYRTRPWVITSVHVGGVLFYDAGAVYQQLSQLDLHQAVGVGVRVLFPQFNRYAFRVDLGVRPTMTGYTVMLSYGSDQVIPLTQAEDDLAATRLSLAP